MMINNNPYNLPDRPPNKPNRIYTQGNNNSTNQNYRSGTTELSQATTPYGQYLARQNHIQTSNTKSSLSIEQNPMYRNQIQNNGNSTNGNGYSGIRNQLKHYLPSPKNHSSSSNNLNSFNSNNSANLTNNNHSSNNAHHQRIGASVDKKQTANTLLHNNSNTPPLRQSFGINLFDMKQLNQKIQAISNSLKNNEKRITELEKNSSIGFLPNNSKFNNSGSNNEDNYMEVIGKYREEWIQSVGKIREEINNMKDEVKSGKSSHSNKLSSQMEKTIAQKCRQILQSSKNSTYSQTIPMHKPSNNQQIKKQLQSLRTHLEQKTKKNFQFLTSVISRLQRQLHSTQQSLSLHNTSSQSFKPSAIKCSTSAILLRFVQCFKVRKHNSSSNGNTTHGNIKSNGQIKITLTDNTYYIDNQGYLLDKEQFYIVDGRDCKVRLEEKHVRLLKEEGIIL